MTCLRLIGTGLLLLAGAVAHADPCKIAIDSNDMMQFSVHELAVPTRLHRRRGHSQARRSAAA